MCGQTRRERQALAMQAYQEHLMAHSQTQGSQTHSQTCTQPVVFVAPPYAGGRHRRGCCADATGRGGRCRRERRPRRQGPISMIVSAIIGAIQNKREAKMLDEEKAREEGVERGVVVVGEKDTLRLQDEEREWEYIDRREQEVVVAGDGQMRGGDMDAPPTYKQAVKVM